MKGFIWLRIVSILAVVVIAGAVQALPVAAAVIEAGDPGGRPIFVVLSGAEEAPGPGDPDGSGTAFFTLNQGLEMVCWELTAQNIDPAAAAHIHRAPAGSPGPIVVPLSPPTSGMSSGCAAVDAALIMEIRHFPENFYVNVHNPAYSAGAIRGQLSK